MFELMVIACLGAGVCHFEASPIPYPTEARCIGQAHIVAGMAKARHPPGTALTYRFTCRDERIVAEVASPDRPAAPVD